ncbi:spermidine/putrescine transport system ATP-binding protein [Roseovarius lutimaris]|uniref:Spermidine/putrescine import ATP-binding protein PotA n=1 Tax=Roseovarius lutimaris TaxID=1005928 RepID=A0A1I5GPM9_9RHOB|nr:ABC transporter ATP-binding protein [Roseovarius lutimaris]SFO38024.1 spermidine/putrescine transport system ATP-binding protein [Roseovarius lutimaris]
MSQPMLQLKNFGKNFGAHVALADVNIEVQEGEFLFLIGPSGCGKTTLLRMIGGYETPTFGEIVIAGKVMNDVPLEQRNIGMVFQNYALFPHRTVWQNVEFGLRMRKLPKDERNERIQEALDMVELGGLGDRYPRQLSGGQRQRVALARVIAIRPDILLLDEPLANLDRRLRDIMQVELKVLQHKLGITSIYVTHDQDEALTMADRIAVIDKGRLLQIGTPDEIYNSPKTTFVAEFLGDATSMKATSLAPSEDGQCRASLELDPTVEILFDTDLDIPEGQPLSLSFRPERIQVAPPSSSKMNRLSGSIEFVSYFGSHVFYELKIGSEDIILKVKESIPNGHQKHRVGETLEIGIESRHIIATKD